MKRPGVLIVGAALLASLAFLGVWFGARERVEVVHFVLPDNYRGYFWVIVDQESGERVLVKHGTATVRVPPDGIVRLHDDWFLEDWHRHSAAFASGMRISTDTDDHASPEALKLWGLGETTGGNLTAKDFLVGTASDYREHFKRGTPTYSFDELRRRLGASTTRRTGQTKVEAE